MQKICLDTGVIGLFFVEPQTNEIKNLMNVILKKEIQAHVVKPVLSEVFFHQCQKFGKEEASTQLMSLVHKYPFFLADLDESLIIQTGILKSQYRNLFSYIDCMNMAYALNNNMPLHSTEYVLQKIPPPMLNRLRVVKYTF